MVLHSIVISNQCQNCPHYPHHPHLSLFVRIILIFQSPCPHYSDYNQKACLKPGAGSCRCWGASKREGERKGEGAGHHHLGDVEDEDVDDDDVVDSDDVNQEIKLDGEVGKLLEAARKERRALEKELNDVRKKAKT